MYFKFGFYFKSKNCLATGIQSFPLIVGVTVNINVSLFVYDHFLSYVPYYTDESVTKMCMNLILQGKIKGTFQRNRVHRLQIVKKRRKK